MNDSTNSVIIIDEEPDENSKKIYLTTSELTGAYEYAKSLHFKENINQWESLNVMTPSMIIGEEINRFVIQMMEEKQIVIKDKIIINNNNNESNKENVTPREVIDYIYIEDEDNEDNKVNEDKNLNFIPIETEIKTWELVRKYPNWDMTLFDRNKFPKIRNKQLRRLEKYIKECTKCPIIHSRTLHRYMEAQNNNQRVTRFDLRSWALEAAEEFQSDTFVFKATPAWIRKFKKKYNISLF